MRLRVAWLGTLGLGRGQKLARTPQTCLAEGLASLWGYNEIPSIVN